MKVLLIDDDINLSKVLAYQLQKSGYQVSAAKNRREGLSLFYDDNYDIVITDIQMPDISGNSMSGLAATRSKYPMPGDAPKPAVRLSPRPRSRTGPSDQTLSKGSRGTAGSFC